MNTKLNAGQVKPGDLIEIWCESRGHLVFTANEDRIQPVPADTYKATVNGELRITLPYEAA